MEICQRKLQRFLSALGALRHRPLQFLRRNQRVAATFPARTRLACRGRRASQQPDRRDGDEQRHSRRRQSRHQPASGAQRRRRQSALDRYVRQRRHVAVEHVQTATIANKKNMEQRDAQTRQKYREEHAARRPRILARQEISDADLADREFARCCNDQLAGTSLGTGDSAEGSMIGMVHEVSAASPRRLRFVAFIQRRQAHTLLTPIPRAAGIDASGPANWHVPCSVNAVNDDTNVPVISRRGGFLERTSVCAG